MSLPKTLAVTQPSLPAVRPAMPVASTPPSLVALRRIPTVARPGAAPRLLVVRRHLVAPKRPNAARKRKNVARTNLAAQLSANVLTRPVARKELVTVLAASPLPAAGRAPNAAKRNSHAARTSPVAKRTTQHAALTRNLAARENLAVERIKSAAKDSLPNLKY